MGIGINKTRGERTPQGEGKKIAKGCIRIEDEITRYSKG